MSLFTSLLFKYIEAQFSLIYLFDKLKTKFYQVKNHLHQNLELVGEEGTHTFKNLTNIPIYFETNAMEANRKRVNRNVTNIKP